MSTSSDLHTVESIVNLSLSFVEEIRSRCQNQQLRLNNQRKNLRANRTKRLVRQAKQENELRELCSSLGLGKPVEYDEWSF